MKSILTALLQSQQTNKQYIEMLNQAITKLTDSQYYINKNIAIQRFRLKELYIYNEDRSKDKLDNYIRDFCR